MKMKNPKKVRDGKLSRARGARFEIKTRADLESKKFIVDRWTNNVSEVFGQAIGEYVRELVPAKPKFTFNPQLKRMVVVGMNSGFPDFVCSRPKGKSKFGSLYEIQGVECKIKGVLDKEEKEKCEWLLKNNVFGKILIAYPEREGRKIIVKYKEFENAR